MNFDLFGPVYSRYARRNAHNAMKTELEVASDPKQAKATSFTDNLAAALKRPVPKADGDIGKNVLAMVSGRIVAVHKCENGVCRTVHVKKCIKP